MSWSTAAPTYFIRVGGIRRFRPLSSSPLRVRPYLISCSPPHFSSSTPPSRVRPRLDLYRLGGSYRSRFCLWPNRKATTSFDDRVASNLAARKVRSRLAATASLSDHRSRTDPTGWRSLLAAAGRFVAEVCIVCAPKPFGFGGSLSGSLREAAGSACTGEADFFPEKKMRKIHINMEITSELERRKCATKPNNRNVMTSR